MFKAVIWLPYIFFAAFLLAGFFWVWFFIPETKGRSLEEMDHVFGSHTGEEDAILLAEARRDVGLTEYLRQISTAYDEGVDEKRLEQVQMLEHSS